MTTVDQDPAPTGVTDRFMQLISPRRRDRRPNAPEPRVVEDTEFIEMLMRLARALEYRACERPENLAQVLVLVQRFNEIINVAIAVNAARFALDPMMGASMAECGRVLGIKKQSASDRRAVGERIIAEREAAAGAVKFSEAKREKEAINDAASHAAEALGESYRARHLRVVA